MKTSSVTGLDMTDVINHHCHNTEETTHTALTLTSGLPDLILSSTTNGLMTDGILLPLNWL